MADQTQDPQADTGLLPGETPADYRKRTGKLLPLSAMPQEKSLEEGDITDYIPNPKSLLKGAALGIGKAAEKQAVEEAAEKLATPVWKTLQKVGSKGWDTVGSGIKVMEDQINPANSRSLQLEKLKKLFGE